VAMMTHFVAICKRANEVGSVYAYPTSNNNKPIGTQMANAPQIANLSMV